MSTPLTEVSQSDTAPANQPDASSEGLDDFDAAMAELTASKDGPPADVAAEPEPKDPEDGSQDGGNQPGPDAGAGKSDQVAADAPAQQSDDIWANAPAELREAHERDIASFTHRLNSTNGRLSAADRELARLRKESGTQPAATQGDQNGEQDSDPFESEDVKRLKEEYGDLADPILNLLKAQADKIAKLEAPVAEVAQQRADEARTTEFSIFATAHPDWEKYVTDERYPAWLSQQPKAVQDAATRAINVEDGQEAAWLLGQFKASIGAIAEAPKPANQPANPQPQTDPKRSRQLAAGRDGGSSAPAVQSGIPDDFDSAVDAILAAREAKANRQGQPR